MTKLKEVITDDDNGIEVHWFPHNLHASRAPVR